MKTEVKITSFFKALILLVLFSGASTFADEFIGKLFKANQKINLETSQGTFQVIFPKKFQHTIDEVMLNRSSYFHIVNGKLKDNIINASQTPTVRTGNAQRQGVLKNKNGLLFIKDQQVKWGRTKPIYNTQFDDISKNSFINKDIFVYGEYQKDGIFLINSVLPTGLFSAKDNKHFEIGKEFRKKPLKYVLKKMPKDKYAQSKKPFREIMFNTKKEDVKPGTPFLMITLSGRQGDLPGAVGGHFAIGMGKVKEDLSLKAELFNFYFAGDKEVPAGHTDYVNYFGHIIQGQNNYRPTFSAIVYGKSDEELKSVRDAIEDDLHKVRTDEKLKLSLVYNCSTTAFRTLKDIGIKGRHETKKINFKRLSTPKKKPDLSTATSLDQLIYGLRSDYATFLPLKTFNSLIESIYKSQEKMGIYRMDYVFYPQVSSKRATGGISAKGLSQTTIFVLLQSNRRKKILKFEKAHEILNNPLSSTKEQIEAKRTIDKFSSDKDFQKTVTLLMKALF